MKYIRLEIKSPSLPYIYGRLTLPDFLTGATNRDNIRDFRGLLRADR